MATAAKSVSMAPIGVEAGQIPLPGTAEMFAAMITGAGGNETPGEGAPPQATSEDIGEDGDAGLDASILLPMLDQQRAATPAAKLVGPAVETSSPVTCMIAPAIVTTPAQAGAPAAPADPIPVAERIDRKGADDCMVAPVTDPVTEAAPVMRPLPAEKAVTIPVTDATPVMRPLPAGSAAPVATTDKSPVIPTDGGKPAASVVTDVTPVMRPLQDGKAAPITVTDKVPVMDPIAGSKPAPVAVTDPIPVMRQLDAKSAPITVTDKSPVMRPVDGKLATVTDPAPVMRPIDNAAQKTNGAPPTTQSMKSERPVATDAAPMLQVKVTQPVTAPARSQADLAPKLAPPQAKATEVKIASPEVQLATAEAQAAPVAAKARASRVSVAPVSIEATPEAVGTTPVAATATETRAAVQPLHAAPALVQPLATPAGAPVQNVAAALSQQVLNMSAGDAWIDQIARDITQTAGKDSTMRFRLAPETLGELKVEITHSERGAHVRLNVASEAAQQALAAAEHKLNAEARAQGVRIAETEINFTGGQSQSRDASAFAREQGQQPQANQPRTPRGAAATPFTSSAAAPEGRGRTDRYA